MPADTNHHACHRPAHRALHSAYCNGSTFCLSPVSRPIIPVTGRRFHRAQSVPHGSLWPTGSRHRGNGRGQHEFGARQVSQRHSPGHMWAVSPAAQAEHCPIVVFTKGGRETSERSDRRALVWVTGVRLRSPLLPRCTRPSVPAWPVNESELACVRLTAPVR